MWEKWEKWKSGKVLSCCGCMVSRYGRKCFVIVSTNPKPKTSPLHNMRYTSITPAAGSPRTDDYSLNLYDPSQIKDTNLIRLMLQSIFASVFPDLRQYHDEEHVFPYVIYRLICEYFIQKEAFQNGYVNRNDLHLSCNNTMVTKSGYKYIFSSVNGRYVIDPSRDKIISWEFFVSKMTDFGCFKSDFQRFAIGIKPINCPRNCISVGLYPKKK
eukprot:274332_1